MSSYLLLSALSHTCPLTQKALASIAKAVASCASRVSTKQLVRTLASLYVPQELSVVSPLPKSVVKALVKLTWVFLLEVIQLYSPKYLQRHRGRDQGDFEVRWYGEVRDAICARFTCKVSCPTAHIRTSTERILKVGRGTRVFHHHIPSHIPEAPSSHRHGPDQRAYSPRSRFRRVRCWSLRSRPLSPGAYPATASWSAPRKLRTCSE